MKKRKIIYLTVILLVFSLILLGVMMFFYQKIDVSGVPVDNDYNNALFSPIFVRSGDSLYYFYYNDSFAFDGLYKITSQKIERIYVPVDKKGGAYLIRTYNNTPIMFYQNEGIHTYDAKQSELLLLSKKSALSQINDSFLITEFGTVFAKKDSYSACYAIALQTNDGEQLLVEVEADHESIGSYYLKDGLLYYNIVYSNKNPSLRANHLHVYDFSNGTDRFVYDFGSAPCSQFLIESNYLVYVCNSLNSLYLIDLNQDILEPTKIYSSSNLFAFNAYNGKIYIPTKEGLNSYDLLSKELSPLCDQKSDWCYIVDDYWVYFVGEKSALWRVPQAGGEAEKVFG